ncbi:hypothetical protein EG329_009600 [Mollisiaceae sp. DMI_Dod_QoI]|nr:hypothetical protein EG329_009600 [Helotiales sp. DMI_Dod_QoI]
MPKTKSCASAPHRVYSLRAHKASNPYSKNFNNRQSTNSQTCTLMKLPVEIRDMIFKLSLPTEWNGKTPEVIKALRQFVLLYEEVMKIFYKRQYVYVLHQKNNWSFSGMEPKVIATIKAVKLMVTEGIALVQRVSWDSPNFLDENTPTRFCLYNLVENCTVAKDVKSVVLDCRPRTINLFSWFLRYFPHFISGFSNLKQVTVSHPLWPDPSLAHVNDDDRRIVPDQDAFMMQAFLPFADDKLGVKHKLEKGLPDELEEDGNRTSRKFVDRDRWVWVADESKEGEEKVLQRTELPPYFRPLS